MHGPEDLTVIGSSYKRTTKNNRFYYREKDTTLKNPIKFNT